MTENAAKIRRFACSLDPKAVHIDYLRIRCGNEDPFLEELKKDELKKGAYAFIAFAEWDVVLFVPCKRLYSEDLIRIYENKDVVTSIAGSAGFYNYVWEHRLNTGWEQRIADLAEGRNPLLADISMLVSVRFTDRFRSQYGLGAELLFCDYLEKLQVERYGGSIDMFAVHSVGWNDVTVMMTPRRGEEHVLLSALRDVRYCAMKDVLQNNPDETGIIAASYSHLLGNLQRYVQTKLEFGTLADHVNGAHLLVRVTPAMESAIRDAYHEVAREVAGAEVGELRTELGHYNFSADITWTFDKGANPDAPVRVIQGLRRKIGDKLHKIKREYSSFAETTSEITFRELIPRSDPPPREPIQLLDVYRNAVAELAGRLPAMLKGRASNMTRHRMAIFLGSISTYLADPVRGSVVGHLCQFLMTTFEPVLERMERDEHEDLCHLLEYALNQATDGLGQFQHDANSLGLSGRGGYVRVIQAMSQWIVDLLEGLKIPMTPLVTYGLQQSHATTAVPHRIDIPFDTAFSPPRWSVLFHEIGHLCWYDIFGWRLESLEVWKTFAGHVLPTKHGHHVRYMHAMMDVAEVFPSYLMLNVAATGDLNRLDRMLLYRELAAVPRRPITPSLRRRMIVHVLLALHRKIRPLTPDHVLTDLPDRDVATNSVLSAKLDITATQWWDAWAQLAAETDLPERIKPIIESAITAFTDTMSEMDRHTHNDRLRSDAVRPTTELIPPGNSFKEEVSDGVRLSLELLNILADDQKKRRVQTGAPDPTYASFGEVLARIDRIRLTAQKSHADWHSAFKEAMEKGFVFADIPPTTMLARLLSDLEIAETGAAMLPSLSVILSLWHRGVTSLLMEKTETLSDELVQRGLICDMGAPGAPTPATESPRARS